MEYHLDREIRLTEEAEHRTLYRWSLQEFKKRGEPVGGKQIPWGWSLYFTGSDICYRKSLKLVGDDEVAKPPDEAEWISAELHSDDSTSGRERWSTWFSMFGTDRNLKSFSLRIHRNADR